MRGGLVRRFRQNHSGFKLYLDAKRLAALSKQKLEKQKRLERKRNV